MKSPVGLIADPERLFWLRPGPPLAWESLGDADAVFDPLSGETHVLNALPALLLQHVGPAPTDYSTLITRLAGPIDLGTLTEAPVLASLMYLEGAELVESRLPSTD